MAVFLFDKIIFGPVRSRRLGLSLGINILPISQKFCNFNCVYCECGFTDNNKDQSNKLKSRSEIKDALKKALSEMKEFGEKPDIITFAGNGEPTIHPNFADIIDDTIELRNIYFPEVKIAVLSNATMLKKHEVFEALKKIEMNILKLDSAFEETIRKINAPLGYFNLEKQVEYLKKFEGDLIIQTMFIKGTNNNIIIDNTTDNEIDAWLKLLSEIKPKQLMIYTIARDTPLKSLEKIDIEQLNEIAQKARMLGIDVQVSG